MNGGPDDTANLWWLCRGCHLKKTKQDWVVYRSQPQGERWRESVRRGNRKKNATPEMRLAVSRLHKGKVYGTKTRGKIAEAAQAQFADPEKKAAWYLSRWKPENRLAQSRRQRGEIRNPTGRRKDGSPVASGWTPERRAAMSARLRGNTFRHDAGRKPDRN